VRIAQRDFETAKVLFERKHYANAVCMLQQSIEKAAKAILIKLGLIRSNDELRREIGHKVSKALKLLESAMALSILNVLDQFLQLSEDRAEYECSLLIFYSLYLMYSFYKECVSKKTQIFSVIEELGEIAFRDVNKDVERKANEYIDEFFTYTYMLSDLVPDEVIEARLRIAKCLSMNVENLKKLLTEEAMKLYLWESLSFLILDHIFFEKAANRLRYDIESIDENKFIVRWSKQIIDRIEDTKMLKCVEEYIEEEVREPKCREILNAILSVFILKLRNS
jgi:HEPN domain-containing protein